MLEAWFAAAAVAAGCGGVARSVLKRRRGADLEDHTFRLASEIVEVAETIEADVVQFRDEPRFTRIAQRCRDCAERARETLKDRKLLRLAKAESLSHALLLLHDDHRRVVDLRLDADRALAARAESQEHEGTWASRFATTIVSNWSSTLSKARPSLP